MPMDPGLLEECVEHGFEGFSKLVDKYHDPVYDRIPNAHQKYLERKQSKKQKRSKSTGAVDQENMRDPQQRDDYRGQGSRRSRNEYNSQEQVDDRFIDERGGMERYDARGDYGVGDQAREYGNGRQQQLHPDDYNDRRPSAQMAAYDDDYERHRRRSHQDDRRDHRGRSTSPGRRHRDRHERSRSRPINAVQIGAGVAGAVAGGIVGHKAGKGQILGTVAGAFLGALGANQLEQKYERREEKKDKEVWEKSGKDNRRERRMSR